MKVGGVQFLERWRCTGLFKYCSETELWGLNKQSRTYYIDAPTTKIHFNRGHAYFIDAPTTKTHFCKARAHDEAHATEQAAGSTRSNAVLFGRASTGKH